MPSKMRPSKAKYTPTPIVMIQNRTECGARPGMSMLTATKDAANRFRAAAEK
jgi:hypothetical protein